jgi:hypothetical protein
VAKGSKEAGHACILRTENRPWSLFLINDAQLLSAGINAAAKRSTAELNDPRRKLPDMPIRVTMMLTLSRSSPMTEIDRI